MQPGLGRAQRAAVQAACDALVLEPDAWWAGASWAVNPPSWFVHAGATLPPELGPHDILDEQEWPEALPASGLYVARTADTGYRFVCGLLMPHELVLAVATDASARGPQPVLDRVGRSLRLLAPLLPGGGGPPPPRGGGTPPTPAPKWTWVPLPGKRPH